MLSRRRWGGPALVLLLVGAISVGAPVFAVAGATARPRTKPVPSKPKPKPKPGWLVDRVRFEPLDRPESPIPNPLEPATGVIGAEGVGDYRGALEVVPAPSGGVAVVNEVAFEDYVLGIAEVPSSWPVEALKAQAIAARTYALFESNVDVATAAKAVGAQICATDACQVYAGVAKERDPAAAATWPNWREAVAQTAGQVVLFQGEPISAKYSSSNGGRSVPGGRPYLRAVDDPDDRFSPLHRWQSTLSLADVADALGLPGTVLNVGRSGDLLFVDWQGGDGGVDRLTIAAPDFRARVNGLVPPPPELPRAVPSIRFTPRIDVLAGTLLLDGAGWGHGVGMSQWGAYGKALRGLRAPDILAAYYAGLRPTQLAPEKLPRTIRVAVDLGRPSADIVGSGRFRVLDGAGNPIAVAASGPWRVVPEGKGVRVLPPPGQEGPPTVQSLALDPGAPTTGAPVTVRFRLTTPAIVRLMVVDGAGNAATVEPGLLDAGDRTQAVPSPGRPGRYVVTVNADAGGGRTVAVPLAVDVRPARAVVSATASMRLAEVRSAAAGEAGDAGGVDDAVRRLGTLAAALLLVSVALAAKVPPGIRVR